jgi:hypothetical protein
MPQLVKSVSNQLYTALTRLLSSNKHSPQLNVYTSFLLRQDIVILTRKHRDYKVPMQRVMLENLTFDCNF